MTHMYTSIIPLEINLLRLQWLSCVALRLDSSAVDEGGSDHVVEPREGGRPSKSGVEQLQQQLDFATNTSTPSSSSLPSTKARSNAMMSGNTRGSAGLENREAAISTQLAELEQQRWMQSEAFYQRSEIRSSLRNHVGALEDAKVALAMFPAHTKYLIRASHASFDNGLPFEAGQLLERAKKTVDPRTGNEEAEQNLAALKPLERRLKPFDLVPDEILLLIFQHVQRDWERLPSPFQLPHVCARWKRIAESTASLWQDLRILRIARKTSTTEASFYPRLKTIYRLMTAEPHPTYVWTRQDLHHDNLIRLCSARSRGTLTHYELDVWNWGEYGEGFDTLKGLINVAYHSSDTLRSIAFIQGNTEQRQRPFDFGEPEMSSAFAAVSFEAVMHCREVNDVELSVGEILNGDDGIFELVETASAEPGTFFRRLQLDCFNGFSDPKRAQACDRFLARSSKLQHLSLRNAPRDAQYFGFNSTGLPFVLRLLSICAETLVNLEVLGQGNILCAAQHAGITSFPELRSYRHVRSQSRLQPARVSPSDMSTLLFPKLESLEAPADIIDNFPKAPSLQVILRLQDSKASAADCDRFAGWLRAIDDSRPMSSITISGVHTDRHDIKSIINALTPSRAGRVVCPNLTQLRLDSRPAYTSDTVGRCPSLDPAPLPPDSRRQEASSVPSLVQLAKERENISQGFPPLEAGRGLSWGRCEALGSIELEGWVFKEED